MAGVDKTLLRLKLPTSKNLNPTDKNENLKVIAFGKVKQTPARYLYATMQTAMSTSMLQKPFAGTTVLATRAGLVASPRRQNRRSALIAMAQDKQQVRTT